LVEEVGAGATVEISLGLSGREIRSLAEFERLLKSLREGVVAELTAKHRVRLKRPYENPASIGSQGRPAPGRAPAAGAASSNCSKSYAAKVGGIRTRALETPDVFSAERRQA
jgi:hypothetical protein